MSEIIDIPHNLPTGEDNLWDSPIEAKSSTPSFFRKWGSLIVLSLALAIIVIDNTLLNVSFATIIRELHTDILSMQWVITAYALVLAAFTITGGRLGDIFGRKKMFMLGAIIFAIGSTIASFANNVSMLIWGEAIIEGIGAVLMLPATSSLLVTNFRGRDRAIAFGVWGGIAAASSAIGPILGGYLTTYYSWRWGFRINILVVLVLLTLSFLIKESRDERARGKIDEVGILLSSYGLFALVFGIIESSQYGFYKAKEVFTFMGHSFPLDNEISISVPAVVIGLLVLVAFAVWEWYIEGVGRTPLVSLKLFKNRQFTTGALTTGMTFMGFSGIIFCLPIFLQAVRKLDAFHTGLALLPMSLALLVASPASAFFGKHFRAKPLIQLGIIIDMIGFLVLYFSLNVDATAWSLSPGLVIFGIGTGIIVSQVNNVTLSAVSVEEAGEASGVNNTIRQLGQTLGTAIIGAVLLATLGTSLKKGIEESRVIEERSKPAIAAIVSKETSQIEFGAGATLPGNVPENLKKELSSIGERATVESNKQALLYGLLFAFWGLVISFLLPNSMKHT